ncbi:pheromone receptor [Coprinopsis cinerea okayama7|uniref:Pheromone receptor n=1 Tax=Coprinopsis cinerea (strain Okayama-7 / 130 / ATCC MYA-4618 / FGSC 9003) TaxID=240176 RepID=A8NKD5_COPC7|nr:pheromone receptor [Coprinopsis cinerea okayama7\|eukprot:XP_001834417.2 pheromone receptor [Coprinopsis cinerea okayama7\
MPFICPCFEMGEVFVDFEKRWSRDNGAPALNPLFLVFSRYFIYPLDVPSLALVVWFLTANFIHAVNSAVWAGNVDIHSEIWCDITTKLLLGVNVAIPGALLCIARQLELVSSSRKIIDSPIVKRNSTIFEVICCYMIPLIYMSLHFVPASNFGTSVGLAIHHSFRHNTSAFATHLSSRSTTISSSSLFSRKIFVVMFITGVSAVTTLFQLFSIPTLKEWTSWDEVHAKLGEVDILSPEDAGNVAATWWILFTISTIFIVLTLAFGEETRDAYKSFVKKWNKREEIAREVKAACKISFRFQLPARRPRTHLPQPIVCRSRLDSSARPHMVELKSGWDDMLDFKYPKSPSPTKRSRSLKSPPISPVSSRSPSSASFRGGDIQSPITPSTGPMSAEETAFMNSTISYLGSPPAHTLGVSAPLQASSPSPVTVRQPPSHPTIPAYHLPRRPVPVLKVAIVADPVLPLADAAKLPATPVAKLSTPPKAPRPQIDSVFQADWPVPPVSPSPTASVSSRYETRSPTLSTRSSIGACSDVPSYYRQPHTEGGRPFEGSSVAMHSPTPQRSHGHHRTPSLKPSLQSLRASWERMRHGSSPVGYPGEGIHMTVVQETV